MTCIDTYTITATKIVVLYGMLCLCVYACVCVNGRGGYVLKIDDLLDSTVYGGIVAWQH